MPAVPTRTTGLSARPSLFESALDPLADALDQLAPGARGELVHQFMMRNGYFDNPDRAASLYQTVPEIDAYLDNLKISRATQNGNRGLTAEQVVAAAMGFGLGLGVAYLVSSAASSGASRQRQLDRR